MFSLASWALLSLLGGFLALWAVWARHISRWRLVSLLGFLASIFISGAAILMSMGWATRCDLLLPGKYSMIGFTFNDEQIFLFLDTEYGPKTCYINYSDEKAEELQKNQEKDGSEFIVQWGGDENGFGIPGFGDEMGEIGARPPSNNHADKPEEETPPVFGE